MLTRLTVRNYALINELDIRFGNGLTIITGETGAGKSILLGALALILGQRADLSALLDKKKKCIVEGFFDISKMPLKGFFKEHDLDHELVSCLRREINPEGKSRAFINDTPVNLAVLKELGAYLIDVHSQHENLALQESDFQMGVVDSCSGTLKDVQAFTKEYRNFVELERQLTGLRQAEKDSIAKADYLRFQVNELAEAALKPDELEILEEELRLLQHSDEIKRTLFTSLQLISGEGQNMLSGVNSLHTAMQQISKVLTKTSPLAERVNGLRIEIKDIETELESLEREIHADPERAEVLSDRIDLINRLLVKHQVQNTHSLLQLQEEMEVQLAGFESLSEQILNLEKETSAQRLALVEKSSIIRKKRQKAIPVIEKQVAGLLAEIGMKHAVLKISLEPLPAEAVRADGADSINFMFSANKGIGYQELSKVASGGELSRLMLCIKSLIAHASGLPTLVFDEIDSGISGEVAGRVGGIVKDISKERQVIAITHLPQMAGKGDTHLFVYKEIRQGVTQTAIKTLAEEERIREIAKMLSGDKPSDAALANARELLHV
jgi:DNA repair protein RecN (Recombination protein N)